MPGEANCSAKPLPSGNPSQLALSKSSTYENGSAMPLISGLLLSAGEGGSVPVKVGGEGVWLAWADEAVNSSPPVMAARKAAVHRESRTRPAIKVGQRRGRTIRPASRTALRLLAPVSTPIWGP